VTAARVEPADFTPGSRDELFRRPSIFLSASVPYRRNPERMTPAEAERNASYVRTSQPARIRDAVAHLCRFAFPHDIQLVFGGHPAISPLVLDAARRSRRAATEHAPAPTLVVVFQSKHFFERIPPETLELADWTHGALLWTERRPGQTDVARERASLTWMREVMVRSPKLLAALFVGGMEGVEEEAELFRKFNPGTPMFALGSTGSAAGELLGRHPDVRGRRADFEALSHQLSYPLLMARIFADLGLGPRPDPGRPAP